MKKKFLLPTFITSLALSIGVISIPGQNKKTNNFSNEIENKTDDSLFDLTGDSEGFYKAHNIEPVAAASFATYTDNPGSTNVYTQDKTWYLDPISIGNTWNSYRGDGVKIAVIDTGLRTSHEDFVYNSTAHFNISEESACFTHNAGDAYSVSKAIVNETGTADWSIIEDTKGHGTNVTSAIASRINNKGTVGVAPNVTILFLKAASLYSDEVSEAIKYAADKNADIITMSLGIYGSSKLQSDDGEVTTDTYSTSASSLYSTAINYAYNNGCLMLASAGNEHVYSSSYPASNNHVIGVGALEHSTLTKKASYSNYNSPSATKTSYNNVDLTANGTVKVAGHSSNTHYTETQGTSFSCPIVAGALALYYQKNNYGGSTNATTRKSHVTNATNALFNSCVDIGTSGWDRMYGYGALDVSKLCGTDTTVPTSISVSDSSVSLSTISPKIVSASLSPIYSANKKINWSSSNTGVATVDDSSITTGEVTITGVAGGSCTITASADADSSIKKTISVSVTGYVAANFTASATTDLHVGDTTKISISWDNGTPTESEILYDSYDPDVVTVDENGNVKAVGVGDGVIYIASADDEQEIEFHVTEGESNPTDGIVFTFGSSNKNVSSTTGVTISGVTVTVLNTAGFETDNVKFNQDTKNYALKIDGSTSNKIHSVEFTDSGTWDGWSSTTSIGSFSSTTWTANSNEGVQSVTFKKTSGKQSKITQIKVNLVSGSVTPTPAQYTVTLNANGGSLGDNPSAQTVEEGTSITLPTLTRDSYTFLGWSTNQTSSTASYEGGASYTVNSNVTLYAIWSQNQSAGGDAGTYYDGINATGRTALLGALHDLSVTNHTYYNSYSGDNSESNYFKTDPYGTSSDYIRDFYTGGKMVNESGSSGWDKWNREHLWCKSMSNGLWSSDSTPVGGGADIQHIRPTVCGVNSARGSLYYGEVTNGTAVTFTDATGATLTGGYKNSSTFEPIDSKKGDVARILMYTYMHYNTYSNVGGTKDDTSHPSYFGTLNFSMVTNTSEEKAIEMLLEWNTSDPVDDIERTRNNEATKITSCRNPFIDHPEYADAIWGTQTTTKTLSSITLSGNYKTTFTVGDTFEFGGTVTANYSDNTHADVTDKVTFSGNDTSTVGTKAVTVSYTEGEITKNASYNIIVSNSQESSGFTEYTLITDYKTLSTGDDVILARGLESGSEGVSGFNGTKDATVTTKFNEFKEYRVEKTTSGIKLYDEEAKTYIAAPGGNEFKYGSAGIFTVSSDGYLNYSTRYLQHTSTYIRFYNVNPDGTCFKVYAVPSEGDNPGPTPDTPKVNSITIPETLGINMDASSTASIDAVVDADAGAEYSVEWISSDTSIATVSGNNSSATVTALKAGTVTITAKISDAIYDTCTVSITKFEDTPPTPSGNYTLLTDASVLKAGDQIVISNTANNVTAGGIPTDKTYMSQVASVFSSDGSTITTLGEGTVEFTLTGNNTDGWTLTNGNNALGCDGAKSVKWNTGTTTWTISVDSKTNDATIANTKLEYGKILYNLGSTRFASYTSSPNNQMLMPQIYYKSGGGTPDPEKEITSIELECNVTTVIFGEGKGTYEAPAKLKATYNDATSGYITPDSENYTVNTYELGNHTISATYEGRTYEKIIKVTNVGSTVESGTFEKNLETNESSNNLSVSTEYKKSLGQTINGVSSVTLRLKVGASVQGNYSQGITFKLYDSSRIVIKTFDEIKKNTSSSTTTYEITFNFTEPVEIASASYTWTTKTSGSNIKKPVFDISCSYEDTAFYGNQSNAWADYLVSLTRTESTCMANSDADKLAGLKEVWDELKVEYNAMVDGAKDEFCTNGNSEIIKHYQYIISKFGKSSKYGEGGLEDFVKDSKGASLKFAQNTGISILSLDKMEPATIVIIAFASIGALATGLYFVAKRRKENY